MKVLIIGKGVIGTIYGWLFQNHGFEIVHYSRNTKKNPHHSVQIDIFDKNNKLPVQAEYVYNITDSLHVDCDLIFISVRHYHLKEALESLPEFNVPILIFGNVWESLEEVRSKFRKTDKLFFGMPRAGGSIQNGKLVGAVLKEVVLEDREQNSDFQKILNLFEKSKRKIQKISKMQDWYWTHMATTTAWICGGVRAKGFLPFANSYDSIKDALKVGKEAIDIAKKRGADISVCEDSKPFLIPTWFSALIVKLVLQQDATIRISEGHGEYAPDEMTKIYEDVLEMGKKLKCKIENLLSYQEDFTRMNDRIAL